jgi:hypothetical protein
LSAEFSLFDLRAVLLVFRAAEQIATSGVDTLMLGSLGESLDALQPAIGGGKLLPIGEEFLKGVFTHKRLNTKYLETARP